jgi:hypothetical protein
MVIVDATVAMIINYDRNRFIVQAAECDIATLTPQGRVDGVVAEFGAVRGVRIAEAFEGPANHRGGLHDVGKRKLGMLKQNRKRRSA